MVAIPAGAEDGLDKPGFVEEVTIVGTRDDVQRVAGSAHFIGAEEIERFSHTDVQRIVRQVPGVSIQVEDGFGLRPNISIRGVATERSGRITLLEDGVLIAPAPYSAPSAYYFPTVGRMAAFEVLKGPAAITQGPYTIGGAFNMISTPIPAERRGRVFAEAGQHATNRLHATYGGTADNGFGFLVESHLWRSDGYQSVDRSDRDTGLDVRDTTIKLAYEPKPGQAFELKLQGAAQESNQSYLGLTDADFHANANRRYGVSSLDHIGTDHEQVIARYEYAPTAKLKFTATAYHNGHARNWFKTEGLDVDGSANAQDFGGTSWANVVQAVNRGNGIGDWSAAELQAVLNGTLDTPVGSIQVRANDRRYVSRGVQGGLSWETWFGDVSHTIKVGARYHEDEEDRLQRNSTYSQHRGGLRLDDLGLLGNAGNRVQQAEALAVFFQDRVEVGAWTLTAGLRYEDIRQNRRRFETRPSRTDEPSSRAPDNLRSSRANTTHVLLPGVGVIYQFNDTATLVAGVHKGFTAPSNAPDVNPEQALNYEFGVRANSARFRFEAMAFLSDYDNLLGECTSSSGVDCEVGDAFNGDAATVHGLEFSASTDLALGADFAVPLELVYTWLEGEFDTDIADTDFFGDVRAGDPLPYIPANQAYAVLGFMKGRWSTHLSATFVDAVCVRASCGAYESTDDAKTLDLSGRFEVNGAVSVFARVENLTDAQDIVGRQPYGARPNKGRTAAIGFDVAW